MDSINLLKKNTPQDNPPKMFTIGLGDMLGISIQLNH